MDQEVRPISYKSGDKLRWRIPMNLDDLEPTDKIRVTIPKNMSRYHLQAKVANAIHMRVKRGQLESGWRTKGCWKHILVERKKEAPLAT